jgi:hypothetical protein
MAPSLGQTGFRSWEMRKDEQSCKEERGGMGEEVLVRRQQGDRLSYITLLVMRLRKSEAVEAAS